MEINVTKLIGGLADIQSEIDSLIAKGREEYSKMSREMREGNKGEDLSMVVGYLNSATDTIDEVIYYLVQILKVKDYA